VRLQDWIVSIQEEAICQIRKGEDVPGWKLVEGRSKRAWATEDEKVRQELIKRAQVDSFKAEEFFEPPTLKSPFQVEKTLKRWKRDPKPILCGLVNQPPGKPTLVEESDPRPGRRGMTKVPPREIFNSKDSTEQNYVCHQNPGRNAELSEFLRPSRASAGQRRKGLLGRPPVHHAADEVRAVESDDAAD
jgi:hypothetical protein